MQQARPRETDKIASQERGSPEIGPYRPFVPCVARREPID